MLMVRRHNAVQAAQLRKVEGIKEEKQRKRKEVKQFVKKTVRFPVARHDEILSKLIAFAEENEVEVR